MQAQMDLLRQLQRIDTDILQMRERRQRFENELSVLKSECDKVQVMVDSLTAEMETLEQERRQLLLDLQKEQDRIGHIEVKLPQIKTQREYLAVLKEIDAAKKDCRDVELAVAARSESLDSLTTERDEKLQQLQELTAAHDSRLAELADDLATLDGSLAEGGIVRERLLKELPPVTRSRYQTLIQRRKGLAVVGARNGACLGCNMHLPPQMFNSLFKMQDIQLCPHCNRMLYLAGDEDQ